MIFDSQNLTLCFLQLGTSDLALEPSAKKLPHILKQVIFTYLSSKIIALYLFPGHNNSSGWNFRHHILSLASTHISAPAPRHPFKHSRFHAALDLPDVRGHPFSGHVRALAYIRLLHLPGNDLCGDV